MRFLPQIGLFQAAGGRKLASGVYWTTLPEGLELGMEAVEDKCIYELARISGTCCVGMILGRYTGTAMGYVTVGSNTGGGKPIGFSLISPTASGTYTWIQKYGKNTSIHVSATFEAHNALTACAWCDMFAIGLSGVVNQAGSAVGGTGLYQWVGRFLQTGAGASQAIGFVNCM